MAQTKKFTRKEIEAHNHKDDAVFIIDNVVYDVSKFMDDHPGGAEVLIDNAGRDASQCFHDVGHSQEAKEWMEKFAVGRVADEDAWEVKKKEVSWSGSEEPLSFSSLASVWGPPVGLALIASMIYMYLF